MKISGAETCRRDVEVEIHPKDLVKALKQHMLKMWGLPSRAYLKDGKWYQQVEYATSHSWFEQKEVRGASLNEVDFFPAILKLEQYFKEQK